MKNKLKFRENIYPIYKKLAEQTFPKLNSPPKQDNHFNLVRKRGRIETSPDSLRPQKTRFDADGDVVGSNLNIDL